MAHDDGHCATANEIIFAQNIFSKCANTAGAGTAAQPYCGLQEGVNAAKAAAKPLLVLRGPDAVDRATYACPGKLAIVGQLAPNITPGAAAGLSVTGGGLYLRRITIEGGAKQGITVSTDASLRAESCTIRNNKGGGIWSMAAP